MPTDTAKPLVVAYGGGTNSTAMLCGFREREIVPDLILFADTGAEHPHTYVHVSYMENKVFQWWGLKLWRVYSTYKGQAEGIDSECLRGGKLPALAYGSRACSVKFKQQPRKRFVRKWMKAIEVTKIVRAIGFGADEAHRIKESTDKWAENWFPLVQWNWRRRECVDAICRNGLPQPGKSSCYICPAMKPSEVLNLKDQHPDLYARALAIEQGAQKRNRKHIGLGGENNFWAHWGAQDNAQGKLLDLEPMHLPCNCTDGD
jgi:hypothetical protein